MGYGLLGRVCGVLGAYWIIENSDAQQGCDSNGHINGVKERHFLVESCPVYHNMSKGSVNDPTRLKDRQQEYKARMTRFLDDPSGYR